MSELPNDRDQAATATPAMGQRLQEAREAAGLSLEAVASQLRLSARQVAALEAERFDELPGRTFVRGFLRNYARLLQLDPEPLLRYAGDHMDRPALRPIAESIGVIPSERADTSRWQKWAIVAILVAALAAGAGYEWWQRDRLAGAGASGSAVSLAGTPDGGGKTASVPLEIPAEKTSQTSPANGMTAKADEPSATPQPGAASPAAATTPLPSMAAPASLPATAAQPDAAPLFPASGTNRAETARNAAPPSPPASTSAQAKKGSSDVARSAATHLSSSPNPSDTASSTRSAHRIELRFDDRSWVEIRDRHGKVLIAQHFAAKQESLVEGHPPFDIIVGNAAVTYLHYDGRPIDLGALARQNVARLRLP